MVPIRYADMPPPHGLTYVGGGGLKPKLLFYDKTQAVDSIEYQLYAVKCKISVRLLFVEALLSSSKIFEKKLRNFSLTTLSQWR